MCIKQFWLINQRFLRTVTLFFLVCFRANSNEKMGETYICNGEIMAILRQNNKTEQIKGDKISEIMAKQCRK